LTDQIPTSPEHFTAFLSVREEAGRAEEHWENEGGHMSATQGRIISTPDGRVPYKVIFPITEARTPNGPSNQCALPRHTSAVTPRAQLREAPYGTATRRTRER